MTKTESTERARGGGGPARFTGVFSLLLTPFTASSEIDWPAYERYVAWQLERRPDGLFAVCGSSEMKWLSLDERIELARLAVLSAGTLPVVATANLGPELASHADEVRAMADTGVAGVVLVPPPGLGEDQQRLGDYFARLVDGSPCPALIYEWPMVHPYFVDAEVFGALARDHGLVGIKDTTCTMEGIGAKIRVAGAATVFQANAPFLLESIRAGARGIMAIVTAAAADFVVDLWKRERSGDDAGARRLHELLVLLDCALGRNGGYPASAKHLATLRGAPMELVCRAPSVASPEVRRAVEVWLAHALDRVPARA